VEEVRQALVGKLGENVVVRRWDRVAVGSSGAVVSYVHMGGKIGVLLGAECSSAEAERAAEFRKLLEDTAMQVAAMAPQYLGTGDVPEAVKAKQSEIFDAQLAEQGKPEKVRPGIIGGKLRKWMEEVCLLEQKSVIETDKSVGALVQAAAEQLKAKLRLTGFVRYQLGEGIDKPVKEDFASEVARMSQGS
jgi:elongation factor Ts